MSETRICAYEPCSKEFEPTHWRQIFCTPTCRANQHYVAHPEKGRALDNGALRCVAGDALDLVRGDAEESPEKARWTLIVREQIARTLHATGYFSVRDLDGLDIPAQHVNVCTSQIGSFASSRYMAKLTWHKSEKASRKGGPYWTFQITEHGREKLPAVLEDTRSRLADLIAGPDTHEDTEGSAAEVESVQGAAPSTGQGRVLAAVPHGAGSSGSVRPSDQDPPDHHHAGVLPATSPYSGENEYA